MGITIYYKGTLNDLTQLDRLKDELIDIAKTLKWDWDELDEDFTKPASAHLIVNGQSAKIKGHLPLKGISLKLHPNCETFNLYFDKKGNLTSPLHFILIQEKRIDPEKAYLSVKTQFAPPEIHIAIIRLLRFLKKRYINDLKVFDDGGYWETSDLQGLLYRLQMIDQAMDRIEQALSEITLKKNEQLTLDKLEKLIEEKLNKRSRN